MVRSAGIIVCLNRKMLSYFPLAYTGAANGIRTCMRMHVCVGWCALKRSRRDRCGEIRPVRRVCVCVRASEICQVSERARDPIRSDRIALCCSRRVCVCVYPRAIQFHPHPNRIALPGNTLTHNQSVCMCVFTEENNNLNLEISRVLYWI